MSNDAASPVSQSEAAARLPAGAGSVDLRLWVRLLACAKMGEKLLRRRFEDDFQTTLPRFDVLAALYAAPGGLRMSELSKALLVSNGNVTVVVRQLQERGDVMSNVNPTDRRSAIITLTPDGRKRFLELAEAHYSWVGELLDGVPEEQKVLLVSSLGDLRTTMSGNQR
ncbi:MarR family winged helix-turn-helix transcriptional regulator [Croceicoccus sediminis]|uniref:MarR family winged helix-turn-helix transcriptional regulator n=1 Tax=Croceicoccus sediminis TaxID=2571150 RepID=UPI001183E4A2|nr:MarR family transcriptional regulator [Croceicoccus sediminis]